MLRTKRSAKQPSFGVTVEVRLTDGSMVFTGLPAGQYKLQMWVVGVASARSHVTILA